VLIDDDQDSAVTAATEVLSRFPEHLARTHEPAMRAKLGLDPDREQDGDAELAGDLLALMREHRVDHTMAFRALGSAARGDAMPFTGLFAQPAAVEAWLGRWSSRLGADRVAVGAAMDRVNPIYIPRNHLVEEALAAATAGDLTLFDQLVEVVSQPFDARPGLARYAEPAPESFGPYQTFCGT
jgi:uncharacterized protein YdiU (UPF0061 family)